MKQVDGAEQSQDKQIAESLREGYLWDGKVLRPELVSIYRFTPPAKEIDEPVTEGNQLATDTPHKTERVDHE